MSLKQLVNTPEIYRAFTEMLTEKIARIHVSLENAREPEEMYRLQGQIYALRRLASLRDEVNTRER